MSTNSYTVDDVTVSREMALKLIYRHTHKDYKGSVEGMKTILTSRGTTTLVNIDSLTDVEVMEKLPYMLKLEEKRKAKNLAKKLTQ